MSKSRSNSPSIRKSLDSKFDSPNKEETKFVSPCKDTTSEIKLYKNKEENIKNKNEVSEI